MLNTLNMNSFTAIYYGNLYWHSIEPAYYSKYQFLITQLCFLKPVLLFIQLSVQGGISSMQHKLTNLSYFLNNSEDSEYWGQIGEFS